MAHRMTTEQHQEDELAFAQRMGFTDPAFDEATTDVVAQSVVVGTDDDYTIRMTLSATDGTAHVVEWKSDPGTRWSWVMTKSALGVELQTCGCLDCAEGNRTGRYAVEFFFQSGPITEILDDLALYHVES